MPEPISLSAILGSAEAIVRTTELAGKIAQLLGMVESIDGKIDKLIEVHLKAGMSALEAAQYSDEEQITLLRKARDEFLQAIHLEKSYRLALALLGLACCHSWLGDKRNGEAALGQILQIDPTAQLSMAGMMANQAANEFGNAPVMSEGWKWGVGVAAVFVALAAFGFAVTMPSPLALFAISVAGALGVVGLNLGRKIATTSGREAVYKANLQVFLTADGDVGRLVKIQKIVASYLMRPIPWLNALEIANA